MPCLTLLATLQPTATPLERREERPGTFGICPARQQKLGPGGVRFACGAAPRGCAAGKRAKRQTPNALLTAEWRGIKVARHVVPADRRGTIFCDARLLFDARDGLS